jgi:membrane associated rhomboid family serine protease
MRAGLDASLIVTGAVFGLCVALHYGFVPLPQYIQSLTDVCWIPGLVGAISPLNLLYRSLTSHVFHVHDMHLYYNMTSWLWKSRQMERRYGSVYYSILILVLSLSSSALSFLFARLLAVWGFPAYMDQCAVGLSAVLFALKVMLFYNSTGESSVLGLFTVSSKYVYWVELLLVQLIDPTASWIGHAAGIGAGLLFVKGFLQPLVTFIASLIQPLFESGGIPVHGEQDRAADREWQNQPPPPANNPYAGLDAAQLEQVRLARLRNAYGRNQW